MEKIRVNMNDLSEFLETLVRYGSKVNNPFVSDSAQTLWDHFYGEEPITKDMEEFSQGEIQFTDDSYITTPDGE